MAEAQAERRRALEWKVPLFETVPFAPLWIWLVITSSWLALFLAYAYAVGSGTWAWDWHWVLINVQSALVMGYLLAGIVWTQRGAVRTLHALRPALRCSEAELRNQLQSIRTFGGRQLLTICLVAICSVLILFYFLIGPVVFEAVSESAGQSGLSPEQSGRLGRGVVAWEGLAYTIVVSLISVFVYTGVGVGRRISQIGEVWAQIDLVDLAPLKPFAEWGLRGVVAWSVLAVLLFFSLFVFPTPEQTIGVQDFDVGGIVTLFVALPVAAVFALFWPVRGVRRQIERQKQAELERIRAEIRSASQVGSTAAKGHLADMVAYEGRIESVNTWLLDRSVLIRFGLILGAGMSMIVGALVERAVDAFLA